ncbi:MAG: low specificity L-threonine aldolase [Alphaproteobacteria bacterium]|nr:low specificity L-threonine aldolase [Alphaproteobacteria bacterium]
MNFKSDNVHGCNPEILAGLAEAAKGTVDSYGDDPVTQRVEARLAEVFEHEVTVFPMTTGSSVNALILASMVDPWGAVLAHPESHINVDECGAPEMFTGGAKIIPIEGENAIMDSGTLKTTLDGYSFGFVHAVQPQAISMTQATEAGAVMSLDEIATLAGIAKDKGLKVHMDGARFANALVALDCSPAEMTWKQGVDVLSFGATKNGCMAAEAAVFFNKDLAATTHYRRKRAGHLVSKMRFVSAQLDAYLADDLWLGNARHANAMADRLTEGLKQLPGVDFMSPTMANEIFPILPRAVTAKLREAGFDFYDWGTPGAGGIRLVTAYATDPADVEAFIEKARGLLMEDAAD